MLATNVCVESKFLLVALATYLYINYALQVFLGFVVVNLSNWFSQKWYQYQKPWVHQEKYCFSYSLLGRFFLKFDDAWPMDCLFFRPYIIGLIMKEKIIVHKMQRKFEIWPSSFLAWLTKTWLQIEWNCCSEILLKFFLFHGFEETCLWPLITLYVLHKICTGLMQGIMCMMYLDLHCLKAIADWSVMGAKVDNYRGKYAQKQISIEVVN